MKEMGFLDFIREKPKGRIKELSPEVREVVEELKKVKDPETELNIVDEGLVYGITVEGKNVMAWLFLARSTPECHFCQAIAMNVPSLFTLALAALLALSYPKWMGQILLTMKISSRSNSLIASPTSSSLWPEA